MPPCFVQNEHVQARAGISSGSGSQASENAMLPQWHLPRISTGAVYHKALTGLQRNAKGTAAEAPPLSMAMIR